MAKVEANEIYQPGSLGGAPMAQKMDRVCNMTMAGTTPMMNMNGTGDMATDDIMPMMNMTMNGTDDMANGTTDASDEMANDTIAEDPEEMPASDDGRRRLY